MICPKCGFEINDDDVLFCTNCGQKLEQQSQQEHNVGHENISNNAYQNNSASQENTVYQDNGMYQNNVADGNNMYPNNGAYQTYPQPVYPNGNPGNTGKKGGKGAISAVIAAVSVAVVAFVVIVALVAGAIMFSVFNKKEKNVDEVQITTAETEREEDVYNSEPLESFTTRQTTFVRKEFDKGDRCRVDDYLDGARSLSVRISPSRSADEVAWAGKGNYVTILEDYSSDHGEYVKISIVSEGGIYNGWVLARYLTEVPYNEGVERQELTPGVKCRVYSEIPGGYKGVSMRNKPRDTEKAVVVVPCDAYVEVVVEYNINDNEYVKVRYNDGTSNYVGWIKAQYVFVVTWSEYEENKTTRPTTTETTTERIDETTVHMSSRISVEEANEIFRGAQDVYEEWYCIEDFDTEQSIEAYNSDTNQTEVYYKVTGDVNTMDELYDILHEYLSDDVCEQFISETYTEYEGELYHYYMPIGFEVPYYIKNPRVIDSGSDVIYQFDSEYSEDGIRYDDGAESYDMVYEDGNWVFDDFSVYDIQYSFE